jgi:hypothetical protein
MVFAMLRGIGSSVGVVPRDSALAKRLACEAGNQGSAWELGAHIKALAPEQAWLEVLASVPDRVSLEHAENLLQGLTQLSSHRLSSLLESVAA